MTTGYGIPQELGVLLTHLNWAKQKNVKNVFSIFSFSAGCTVSDGMFLIFKEFLPQCGRPSTKTWFCGACWGKRNPCRNSSLGETPEKKVLSTSTWRKVYSIPKPPGLVEVSASPCPDHCSALEPCQWELCSHTDEALPGPAESQIKCPWGGHFSCSFTHWKTQFP